MKLINLFLLLVVLVGCASQYSQLDSERLRDYQISDDQFCISSSGNRLDSSRSHAYIRACELTKQHGFNYFFIISEVEDSLPGMTHQQQDIITLNIKCFKSDPPVGAIHVSETI